MRLEAQSLAPYNSSSVMVMEELLKFQMKDTFQMTTTILGTKKGKKIEMKVVKIDRNLLQTIRPYISLR